MALISKSLLLQIAIDHNSITRHLRPMARDCALQWKEIFTLKGYKNKIDGFPNEWPSLIWIRLLQRHLKCKIASVDGWNPDLWCIKTWKQQDQHGQITNLKWYQIGPRFAVPQKFFKNPSGENSYGGKLLVKEPSSCPLHKFEGLRSTIGPVQGLKVFSHLSLRQLVQRIVGGSMQQANGQNLRDQFNWLRAQNFKTELKSKTMITSHLLMGGREVP